MPKSIRVSAKKRGRPATGLNYPVIIQVRLSEDQAASFDTWADSQGMSRSEGIRQVIAEALQRNRPPGEPPRGNIQVADAGGAKRKRS